MSNKGLTKRTVVNLHIMAYHASFQNASKKFIDEWMLCNMLYATLSQSARYNQKWCLNQFEFISPKAYKPILKWLMFSFWT